MSKATPFLFCRYAMHMGDDLLDATGTYEILNEFQGKYMPSGPAAEQKGEATLVIMRPEKLEVGNENVVKWVVGHKPGHRTVTQYDSDKKEIKYTFEKDNHILHTAIYAIPRIGALAVGDRVNTLNMGGKPALSRTRAIFRKIPYGSFNFWFLNPGDIAAIVGDLELLEYAYTVRRINPTAPGPLAAALDASMEKEGVGIRRGVDRPMPGESMKAKDQFIAASTELAAGGYGVLGFKGHTADGHLAQIKKPPFSLDKRENLKQQEREHPLRVFVEGDDEDAVLTSVVGELVRFYGRDDQTEIHQEPA